MCYVHVHSTSELKIHQYQTFILSDFDKHDKTTFGKVLKNYVHRVQSHLKFSKL